MFKKILICLLIVGVCATGYAADFVTTNYKLIVPEFNSRDWGEKLSNDIITIDALMWGISTDLTIISSDISAISNTVTILSNDVQEMRDVTIPIISSDVQAISNTVVIISNDAAYWTVSADATKATIISNDLAGYTGPLLIVSSDVSDLKDLTTIISSDIGSFGEIVQIVNVTSGDTVTGSTAIPYDDTIPQITEGEEYMALEITPTSATNALLILAKVQGCNGANGTNTVALFQDSTADALTVAGLQAAAANTLNEHVIQYYMLAGTTSATTFRIRAGGTAGTWRFNGTSAGRTYFGRANSSLTIMEIKQ